MMMYKTHKFDHKVDEDVIFASRDSEFILPKYKIPKEQSDSKAILEIVKDELFLDGNARQNLATFTQTYEDEYIKEIMEIGMNKNMIDKDEYPQTAEIESRIVSMLADLWNSPNELTSVGTSTVGSSEACMLGGLAMYHRWRMKRLAEDKDVSKPNLVTGPVQVVWEKFAKYWDIELREIPMEEGRYYMDPDSMLEYIDENTIGIVTTLGLTFTGEYEPIEKLSHALDKLEEKTGLDIDMHIDAASGGFLAPFCAPKIKWDFRLPRVKSISASGHKFGLAPLGCGFVVWRDEKDLPDDLIFHVNYLGGDMSVFQLNFSRPAGPIIAQYYQLLRLGFDGYKKVHMNCYKTAQYLAKEIEKLGVFEIIFDGNPNKGIPAVTWRLKEDAEVSFNLYDFADKLRSRGWLVPAYSLPKYADNVVVQRILVRQGFGLDMASLLMQDIKRTLKYFETHRVVSHLNEEDVASLNHTGR